MWYSVFHLHATDADERNKNASFFLQPSVIRLPKMKLRLVHYSVMAAVLLSGFRTSHQKYHQQFYQCPVQ
jgi:hypothetical protein